jgi:hypothetical protein
MKSIKKKGTQNSHAILPDHYVSRSKVPSRAFFVLEVLVIASGAGPYGVHTRLYSLNGTKVGDRERVSMRSINRVKRKGLITTREPESESERRNGNKNQS